MWFSLELQELLFKMIHIEDNSVISSVRITLEEAEINREGFDIKFYITVEYNSSDRKSVV